MVLIDDKPFYYVEEITEQMIFDVLADVEIVRHKDVRLLNCPVSFDTETSSITDPNGDKHGILYLWQMDINGLCFYGRTCEQFKEFIDYLTFILDLNDKFRMVVYIQNLSFEFQWLRKYFTWSSVFARESRKPMKAVLYGFEFRCSYFLSGYSLSKIAENLHSHSIRKLTEKMDYSLIRTPETELTYDELSYSLNDVVILEYYIAEEIERNGHIGKIPLTQTGYVRRYCKEHCLPTKDKKARKKYVTAVQNLTIEPEEYPALKRAFAGGFTHANARYVGKVVEDVTSFDFCSSYPAVMVMERFPITLESVMRHATSSKSIFKQHIMRALIDYGYALEFYGELNDELFNLENGSCLVEREYPDVKFVLDLIHSARGVAVMAHPMLYRNVELLVELAEMGKIDGVEVDHYTANETQREELRKIAQKYNLIVTGGSDFHGLYNAQPTHLGSNSTSKENLDRIIKLANKKEA